VNFDPGLQKYLLVRGYLTFQLGAIGDFVNPLLFGILYMDVRELVLLVVQIIHGNYKSVKH
jgi:hypothetical protein